MVGEYKLRYKDPEYSKKYEEKRSKDSELFLKSQESKRRWRERNPEKVREYSNKSYLKRSRENPEWRYFRNVKSRAKRLGLEFNLDIEDIIFPDVCPILGIPIFLTEGKVNKNSPSIDRIDNGKGYTKDNVRVISYRANILKSDMTLEQVGNLLAYMKHEL